jgi:hypothetical protein
MGNVIAVQQHHWFSSSWMCDDEVFHYIFIGDKVPSIDEVKAVFEYEDEDNGQDGSTYAEVVKFEVVEDGNFKKDEYVGSKHAEVIDIANKRVGVIKQVWHPERKPIAEQEVVWSDKPERMSGSQFF